MSANTTSKESSNPVVPESTQTPDPLGSPPLGKAFADDSDALDALMKELSEDGKPDGESDGKPEGKPDGESDGKPDGKSDGESDGKPGDTPPADTPPADTPPADTPPADTPPADTPPFEQRLDSVELPPHARPKSAEAFSTVKTLAKQEVERIRKELEETRSKLRKIEPKVGKLTPELEQELTELRNYRAATKIDSAPELKQADAAVASAEEQVLAALKEAGMPDDGLEKVKKMGLQNVDWAGLLKEIPPEQSTVADYLRFKVAEHRSKLGERAKVQERLKTHAAEFLKQETERVELVRKQTAEDVMKEVPFANEVQIPPDAPEATRKELEARNATAKELRRRVQIGLSDTSPEMHATLAVSAALAFQFQAQNKAWAKAYSDLKAASEKSSAELQKKLDEATAELMKIRGASRGQRATMTTPAAVLQRGGKYKIGVSGEEALDALRLEVAEQ